MTGETESSGAPVETGIRPLDLLSSAIFRVLYAVRKSFFVFFMSIGVLLILWGAIRGTGELAGILGVLGTMAVVYGLLGRLAMLLIGY